MTKRVTLAQWSWRLALTVFTMMVSIACGSDGDGEGQGTGEPSDPKPGDGTFETAWPGAGTGGETLDTATDDGASEGLGAPGANAAFGNAGRVIQEADIIQVHGDRLYALSSMSGLNIVDVSDPGDLQLIGSYRETQSAEPFEMYLEDGVAIVMFNSWGKYVQIEADDGGDGYAWVQSSEVVALDVQDPGDIRMLGSFQVAGAVSDSRIVGDVLYVVGYEDGYCWGCDEGAPRTRVISLNVADPRAITKIDDLAFDDQDNDWGWSRRSVTVTTERMYVAGPEHGERGPTGSSIQVVDISDPAGDMELGATVEVVGEISSRWQMDEHEGVLRVISQPPQWNLEEPPVIQTFTVVTSDELTPLGSTAMRLPRPEQLQSVRFDGLRAYAITFERTDPLFTIDLSEPATPRQLGELEIPGFVYHMEPRGDRLIGLGFDQGNPDGAITVSLFDISTFEDPQMIDRVNFGGDWGYLPEDQNRIHKVFRVLDDAGLILVPHSGHSEAFREEEELLCAQGYDESRVQLVNFTLDTLDLQGALPTRGEARRALLRGEHVLTVSDEEVASFDVSDRAAPEEVDSVAVARNVLRALPLDGDVIARFSRDWWNGSLSVDFVSAADAAIASAGRGELDLAALFDEGDGCTGHLWVQDAVASDSRVTVLYSRELWSEVRNYEVYLGVLVIDATDPGDPSVVVREEWGGEDNWWFHNSHYAHGIPVNERGVVQLEGGLALLEMGYEPGRGGEDGRDVYRVRVIDLRDESDPGVHVVDLPADTGYFGLSRSGPMLYTSHFEPVAGSPGITRFYLDRIDVSDPGAPALQDGVNVPGVVLHHDAGEGYAVTMDLIATELEDATWEECGTRFAISSFDDDDWNTPEGDCTGYQQIVRLASIDGEGASLEASYEIDEDEALRRLSVGDARLVGTIGQGNNYYGGLTEPAIVDCFGPCGFYGYSAAEPEQLLVLSGMASGELRSGSLELDAASDPWAGWWGPSHLVATGERALVTSEGEMAIIDLSDPEQPELERSEAFSGYAESVSVRDDRVVLALGVQGCRVVDM